MADKNKESGPFMFMVHKDFEDREPAKVTRAAFEKVWKEKGWKETGDPAKATSAVSSSSSSKSNS